MQLDSSRQARQMSCGLVRLVDDAVVKDQVHYRAPSVAQPQGFNQGYKQGRGHCQLVGQLHGVAKLQDEHTGHCHDI
jgi:hypothetical protein